MREKRYRVMRSYRGWRTFMSPKLLAADWREAMWRVEREGPGTDYWARTRITEHERATRKEERPLEEAYEAAREVGDERECERTSRELVAARQKNKKRLDQLWEVRRATPSDWGRKSDGSLGIKWWLGHERDDGQTAWRNIS